MATHLSSSFDYRAAEYEEIPCNLCGRRVVVVLARHDQNRLPVKTCLCRHCGLMYINPRMKKEWYGKYYETEYRAQRARYEADAGKHDVAELFRSGEKFGSALADMIRPYVLPGVTVEVGSSAGGVLSGFAHTVPGLIPRGIEPSPSEAAYARSRGIETHVSLLEDVGAMEVQAANIICVRTLNHLLDPRWFFEWAYRALLPGGKIILAVLNFRHSAKKRGSVARAAQIDHVYMFTPETITAFIKAAGFDIEFFDSSEDKNYYELSKLKKLTRLPTQHMRIVAKKSERAPFSDLKHLDGLGDDVLRSMRRRYLLPYFLLYRFQRFADRAKRIPQKLGRVLSRR